MGSKKYFITGVIVMTVLNGLDFLVTLKTIPSLEFEANPILDEFNLGWIGLLIFGMIKGRMFPSQMASLIFWPCICFGNM